jgi:hypothetical protein
VNTTASIKLPAFAAGKITLNHKPVSAKHAELLVGSGDYVITCKYKN